MTSRLLMMKLWVCGKTRKSLIPGTLARSTETIPSSGPGMSHENKGLRLRLPAMDEPWKKMAGVAEDKELEILALPKSKSFLDSLLDSGADSRLRADLGKLPLLRDLPEVTRKLRSVRFPYQRYNFLWKIF